jgi:hypothetical protein
MDPLAAKVARRFTAELLTKQWLMGVRRGWLTLLKPNINGYREVFEAIDRLYTFASNLRDQVLNVRQVVDKEDVDKVLTKLLNEITRARQTASHWNNSYLGAGPGGPNEHDRKAGEQMLDLYKTNFEGAVSGSKPQRGGRGLDREAPLTEFLDDALKLLYSEAKYLDKEDKTRVDPEHPNVYRDPVFKEFDFGGVKVVVVDPKHNGMRIRAYVEFIEKAHKDIKRKGFGAVWYGVFFLMSDSYEALSKSDQEAYAKAGYKNMEGRAGTYHSGPDIIRITAPPTDDILRVIVHELGHRYWFKQMSQGQRARFESLIEGDWSMVHAILLNHTQLTHAEHTYFSDLYNELESGRDLMVDEKDRIAVKFKELGLRGGVPLVSEYARSRPTEAFAEVFERYVSESDLTRDQVESFRSVLSSSEDALLGRVVQAYIERCLSGLRGLLPWVHDDGPEGSRSRT